MLVVRPSPWADYTTAAEAKLAWATGSDFLVVRVSARGRRSFVARPEVSSSQLPVFLLFDGEFYRLDF